MLVSHKLKFLYIHIPKNWGSSLYTSFKQVDEDLIDTHMPDEGNRVDKTHMLPQHHCKYEVIQSAIDDGYKIFSTIREPEDRFYSFLKYARTYLNNPNHRFYDYCYINAIRNKAYLQSCMFIHGCPQSEFIYDGERKITDKDFLCDENLFENLSEYFGVEIKGSHKNPSPENVENNIEFDDFKDIYKLDQQLYNALKS
ncbi:MAG: hypothetical protein HWN81_02040 [Candidatus Lokiarchaeota archaeon]|nr:hypothetical protein [Candidatus Lokiarchaeota archaeon]